MTALEFEVLELARDIEAEQSLSALLTHDDDIEVDW